MTEDTAKENIDNRPTKATHKPDSKLESKSGYVHYLQTFPMKLICIITNPFLLFSFMITT